MAANITTHSASIKKLMEFSRHCTRCGHDYIDKRPVRLESQPGLTEALVNFGHSGFSDAASANRSVHDQLQVTLSLLDSDWARDTCGVFCPTCKDFTPDAYQRHFPNGIRRGVFDRFKQTIGSRNSWIADIVCSLVGLLLYMSFAVLLFGADDGSLIVMIPSLLVAFATFFGIRTARARFNASMIEKAKTALRLIPKDHLRAIVAKEYKRSRESLTLLSIFEPASKEEEVFELLYDEIAMKRGFFFTSHFFSVFSVMK